MSHYVLGIGLVLCFKRIWTLRRNLLVGGAETAVHWTQAVVWEMPWSPKEEVLWRMLVSQGRCLEEFHKGKKAFVKVWGCVDIWQAHKANSIVFKKGDFHKKYGFLHAKDLPLELFCPSSWGGFLLRLPEKAWHCAPAWVQREPIHSFSLLSSTKLNASHKGSAGICCELGM